MIRARAALLLVGGYALLALVPLAVALVPPSPPGRPFLLELSLALGFIGLGQLALQFGLIARFEKVSRPFGIDLVMHYHRGLGQLSLGLVLLHPLVLFFSRPRGLSLLNPFEAGWAVNLGTFATACLLGVVGLSLYRRRLGLSYELWRLTHALLALGALVLALWHTTVVGAYVGTAAWKGWALWLWTLSLAGLVLYLRLVKPLLLGLRPWVVEDVQEDLAESWTVRLRPVGHPGRRFFSGQFAWLKLDSPWSADEHPFSFSSSADRPGALEFGIKELGDFTRTVGTWAKGRRAYLDGPHGSFSPEFHPEATSCLFVAGGIGISPLLSMIRTLVDRRDARPHVLVYACSAWDRVAFRRELEEAAQTLSLKIVYVLERPPEGWQGPSGYPDLSVLRPVVDGLPRGAHAFVCGPDRMMDAVEQALDGCGLSPAQVHLERFNLV